MKILSKLKEDFMKVPYRIHVVFLFCLLLSILLTACMSVGPSRKYVERDVANASEIIPIFVSLIESSTQEQLIKAAKEEDKENLSQATSTGIEVYKMGLIRKSKNWLFLINSENDILQKHDKKSE